MLLPTPATLQMMANWTAAAVNEIKEKRHDQQGMDNLANKAWRRCGNAFQCEQNRDKVGRGWGPPAVLLAGGWQAWAGASHERVDRLCDYSSVAAPRAHAPVRSPASPSAALTALPLASLRSAGWLTHPVLDRACCALHCRRTGWPCCGPSWPTSSLTQTTSAPSAGQTSRPCLTPATGPVSGGGGDGGEEQQQQRRRRQQQQQEHCLEKHCSVKKKQAG